MWGKWTLYDVTTVCALVFIISYYNGKFEQKKTEKKRNAIQRKLYKLPMVKMRTTELCLIAGHI